VVIIESGMTAKEKLLEHAALLTEEQAVAALRAVEAQSELGSYLDAESSTSEQELDDRELAWAKANARDAIRDERW
jgi:hypothetical protein